MGYDMYLYKCNKQKIRNINELYYEDIIDSIIAEVNSYYPVLQNFHYQRNDVSWKWEEYNIVPEDILTDIISWLEEAIKQESWYEKDFNGIMTKYVYEEIKNWIPLKDNEIVYFEEDA